MDKGDEILQGERVSNDGVSMVLENDFLIMTYKSHVIYQRKLVTAPHAIRIQGNGDFVAVTRTGDVLETFARGGDKFMIGASGLGMYVRLAKGKDPQTILFRTSGSDAAKKILSEKAEAPLTGGGSVLGKGQSIADGRGLTTNTSQMRFVGTVGLVISYKSFVVDRFFQPVGAGAKLAVTNDSKFVIMDKNGKIARTIATKLDSVTLSPIGDLIGRFGSANFAFRSTGTATHRVVESFLAMTQERKLRLAAPPRPSPTPQVQVPVPPAPQVTPVQVTTTSSVGPAPPVTTPAITNATNTPTPVPLVAQAPPSTPIGIPATVVVTGSSSASPPLTAFEAPPIASNNVQTAPSQDGVQPSGSQTPVDPFNELVQKPQNDGNTGIALIGASIFPPSTNTTTTTPTTFAPAVEPNVALLSPFSTPIVPIQTTSTVGPVVTNQATPQTVNTVINPQVVQSTSSIVDPSPTLNGQVQELSSNNGVTVNIPNFSLPPLTTPIQNNNVVATETVPATPTQQSTPFSSILQTPLSSTDSSSNTAPTVSSVLNAPPPVAPEILSVANTVFTADPVTVDRAPVPTQTQTSTLPNQNQTLTPPTPQTTSIPSTTIAATPVAPNQVLSIPGESITNTQALNPGALTVNSNTFSQLLQFQSSPLFPTVIIPPTDPINSVNPVVQNTGNTVPLNANQDQQGFVNTVSSDLKGNTNGAPVQDFSISPEVKEKLEEFGKKAAVATGLGLTAVVLVSFALTGLIVWGAVKIYKKTSKK